MSEPVTKPILWIHPRRCLLRAPLRAAEVRRTMTALERPSVPVGYDVGCPACGFRGIWLEGEERDEVHFVEGPSERVVEEVKLRDRSEVLGYWRPSTLSVVGSYRCRRCGRTLTIRDGAITAA